MCTHINALHSKIPWFIAFKLQTRRVSSRHLPAYLLPLMYALVANSGKSYGYELKVSMSHNCMYLAFSTCTLHKLGSSIDEVDLVVNVMTKL